MKKKVFLGGTCGKSTWREGLIPLLEIDYFNPVVEDWTPECQQKEIEERENCDYCLYVITSEMEGFYSIAEVIDDSNKRPKKTIFCVSNAGKGPFFNKKQLKSFEAIENMVKRNGGTVFHTLTDIADFLNQQETISLKKKLKKVNSQISDITNTILNLSEFEVGFFLKQTLSKMITLQKEKDKFEADIKIKGVIK